MDTQNIEPGYYMDGYLKHQVATIRERLKRNWDCVGIVDGTEGGGKTTFAFQLCYAVDPTFNIDRVCFNEKQFYDQIVNCQPGQAVCLDEAMNVFFSRATMSAVNIGMVRVMAECRKRNLFLLIVLPSFFELDRYVAMHRSSFLCHIYAMPTPEGILQRGFFKWYDKKAKKKLLIDGKKKMLYWVAKPTFFGRFTKHWCINEKEYNHKKDKALEEKDNSKKIKKKDKEEIVRGAIRKMLEEGLVDGKTMVKNLRLGGMRISDNHFFSILKEEKNARRTDKIQPE